MLAAHPCPRMPSLVVALALLVVLGLALSLLGPPSAEAKIVNGGPIASVVDCIRSGESLGETSDFSPRFAMSCMASAWERTSYNYDQPGAQGDAPRSFPAVVEFGDGRPDGPNEPGQRTIASLGSGGTTAGSVATGTVFGLAYSSGSNPAIPASVPVLQRNPHLFAAAYTKRVTRYGPLGPGGIYLIDPLTRTASFYAQVPGVVPGPATAQPGPAGFANRPGDGSRTTFLNHGLPGAAAFSMEMGGVHTMYENPLIIPLIGKVGLGGIDVRPDEWFLGGVNLHQRSRFFINMWTSPPTVASVPLDAGAANCPGGVGNFRPFAFTYANDEATASGFTAYVGYVCSAESTQNRSDLYAGVLRIDGASHTRVLHFRLDAFDAQRNEGAWEPGEHLRSRWEPWSNSLYHDNDERSDRQQPMLTSIAFAEDGSMLLGLRSRTADMGTTIRVPESVVHAAGDILRAAPNGSGGWHAPTTGGDHFRDEAGFGGTPPRPAYVEAAQGGVTTVPGTSTGAFGGEVVSTISWPHGTLYTGGVSWFNQRSGGARTGAEQVYEGNGHFKSSGLGDVELLCAWRAIGNRVWRDSNANGMQDPGEPDMSGVRLELLNASGAVIERVTTGAVDGAGDNWRFYVQPYQDYSVRIDPAMFNAGQPLHGLVPTRPQVGSDRELDSDANAAGLVSIAAGPRSQVELRYDLGLTAPADFWVTKTGPASAAAGSQFSYSLSYGNRSGVATARNVTLVDTLPTGLSYVSATGTHTRSGQTITWNLGDLASGATGSRTITVQAATSFSPTTATSWARQNCATISATTPDRNPTDNNACATTTLQQHDLVMTKTGPATAAAGARFSYTLNWSNRDHAAQNVTIIDTLPSGLSYVAASGTHTRSGQAITWNLGTQAAGASGSLTVTVDAAATFSPASLTSWARTNCATISSNPPDVNTADNQSCVTTTLQRLHDLAITKTMPASAAAGARFSYTLNWSNSGGTAQNVAIVDTLQSGLSYVAATGTHTRSGQTITWSLGTQAAGASGSLTITVDAATSFSPTTATSWALASTCATINSNPADTATANNSACASTMLQRPELSVSKSGPITALVGDEFDYTIQVRNTGAIAAAGVRVVDTLPAGLTYVSTPAGGMPTVSGQTLTWNLGTRNAGTTATITVRVRATVAAATPVTNTASVSTSSLGDTATGNSATAITSIQFPDPLVTVHLNGPLPVGEWRDVTLSYRNQGAGLARTSVLTATLEAGVQLDDLTLPSGCTRSADGPVVAGALTGPQVQCQLGDLAANQTTNATLNLRLRLPATPDDAASYAGDSIRLAARIDTATPERPVNQANNSALATTNVTRPNAYVRVTALNQSAPQEAGWRSFVRFQVDYGNDVASTTLPVALRRPTDRTRAADGTQLIVTLPANTQGLPAVARVGGGPPPPYSVNGDGTLSLNLGTLAPRAFESFYVTVEVSEQPGAEVRLAAQISTTTPGDELVDNQAQAALTILPPPVVPAGSGELRLAIHSTFDPERRVYLSEGTSITWPAGEVLDFTPRLNSLVIDHPTLRDPTSPYGLEARITGWSLVSLGLPSGPVAASGADAHGRSGCRLPAAGANPLVSDLSGCVYSYPGASEQWARLSNVLPSLTLQPAHMTSQGHVYWTHQGVAGTPLPTMRPDVYLFALPELRPVQLTVAVEAEVRVLNLYPGAPVGDWSLPPVELTSIPRLRRVYPGTFTVTLLVPRSVVGPGS